MVQLVVLACFYPQRTVWLVIIGQTQLWLTPLTPAPFSYSGLSGHCQPWHCDSEAAGTTRNSTEAATYFVTPAPFYSPIVICQNVSGWKRLPVPAHGGEMPPGRKAAVHANKLHFKYTCRWFLFFTSLSLTICVYTSLQWDRFIKTQTHFIAS